MPTRTKRAPWEAALETVFGTESVGAPARIPAEPQLVQRTLVFGVRTPTKRKAAVLDDALGRQAIGYGRALEAVKADAVRWMVADARGRRTGLSYGQALRYRLQILACRTAIERLAYRAAQSAAASSNMADGIVKDVLDTLTTWISWRARVRQERPKRIADAKAAQAADLADMPTAIAKLRARVRRPIAEANVRAYHAVRLERARRRHVAAYPVGPRLHPETVDYPGLLDAFAASTDREDETQLWRALNRQPRSRTHPLHWKRPQTDKDGRGVSLFWEDNRLFAFLPILLPVKGRHRPIRPGPKRLVGIEDPQRVRPSAGVVLALTFSKAAWGYLDDWTPRTARLCKIDDRYELHMVFAQTVAPAQLDLTQWLGIDRGVINMAATADLSGTKTWVSGNKLAILDARMRRQREQDQRNIKAKTLLRSTKRRFRNIARNEVNRIAKQIVRQARQLNARVSAENLTGFTYSDSRILVRAQYAQLLKAVEHRLERHGYPPLDMNGQRVWRVPAPHTSRCCSRCGHNDAANRPTRERFACTACSYAADPDINAAVNIARRAHEVISAHKGRKGRAVGPDASASGVVARPVATNRPVPDGGAKSLDRSQRAPTMPSAACAVRTIDRNQVPKHGKPAGNQTVLNLGNKDPSNQS